MTKCSHVGRLVRCLFLTVRNPSPKRAFPSVVVARSFVWRGFVDVVLYVAEGIGEMDG